MYVCLYNVFKFISACRKGNHMLFLPFTLNVMLPRLT